MESLFSGVAIAIIGMTVHKVESYKYWIFVIGLNTAIHLAIKAY